MSRTIISEPGPLNPNVDLKEVLNEIQENAQGVMFDMDKAGDIVDHEYYAGLYDAYMHIRELLTSPDAWSLAEKTSSLIGDPSTYQALENHMNEQTAVDIAENIVPETIAVAHTIQTLIPFAAGVGTGVALVVVGRKVYLKRKNREVVAVPSI